MNTVARAVVGFSILVAALVAPSRARAESAALPAEGDALLPPSAPPAPASRRDVPAPPAANVPETAYDEAPPATRPARPILVQPTAAAQAATDDRYGRQILLANLAAFAVGGGLTVASNNVLPLLAASTFTGPVVHMAHGQVGMGILSLAAHVGLPLIGAGLGYSAEHCSPTFIGDPNPGCGSTGLAIGGILGMIGASALDVLVLTQIQDAPPSAPARAVASGGGATSAPGLAVGRNGDVTIGWRGTF